MNIAYIISAYQRPSQLIRLVDRLDAANTWFAIHVDRKTDRATFREMQLGLAAKANVHFVRRHVCNWGDFGHVAATLKGMDALFARRIPFDYLFLLSGQDYPLRSNDSIRSFLEASQGKSYMSYMPLPQGCDSRVVAEFQASLPPRVREEQEAACRRLGPEPSRIEHWHVHLGGRYFCFPGPSPFRSRTLGAVWKLMRWALPQRRLAPRGLDLYWGGSYWCLSREAAEYVHDFVHRHTRFVRFFKYVRVPDEIMFHTILANSPLRGRIVNQSPMFMCWVQDRRPANMLLSQDVDVLVSSPCLFARKFDVTVDAGILDVLDRYALGSSGNRR